MILHTNYAHCNLFITAFNYSNEILFTLYSSALSFYAFTTLPVRQQMNEKSQLENCHCAQIANCQQQQQQATSGRQQQQQVGNRQ